MRRILFVANGHGETAIAARIAREVVALSAGAAGGLDLIALVGTGAGAAPLALVGPRRAMPSGGLVAMGNVRAFASDLGAGFLPLLGEQLAFLRAAHAYYDVAVAVGDAYALGLTLLARLPTVFVGTAKSAYVAPYGPFERTLLRRALAVYVRDEPTAIALRSTGVDARAPGNVIVDLVRPAAGAPPGEWIGLLPGSRDGACAQGVRLARVLRDLAGLRPQTGGLLSIAATVEPAAMRAALEADGWAADREADLASAAFALRAGSARLLAWPGDLGALLGASRLVLGQAGTANEQAAALGVPVVALDDVTAGEWYRMRQRRLLGEALALVPPEPAAAAPAVAALLADSARLAAMAEAGRARMGPPGGSAAIARTILEVAA